MKEYLHNGARGDIIYALPTIKVLGRGIIHTKAPFVPQMRDLLLLQSCIEDVKPYDRPFFIKDENFKLLTNLDIYRMEALTHPSKHLAFCYADPLEISVDIDNPWLENIEPVETLPIVINRTTHYHSYSKPFPWTILREYKDKVLFVGTQHEWLRFTRGYQFDVEGKTPSNVLELARTIKGAKLFIGNQSLCFALAESMKCPRILEVYEKFPNCMPHGKDGYTTLSEDVIEVYLNGR